MELKAGNLYRWWLRNAWHWSLPADSMRWSESLIDHDTWMNEHERGLMWFTLTEHWRSEMKPHLVEVRGGAVRRTWGKMRDKDRGQDKHRLCSPGHDLHLHLGPPQVLPLLKWSFTPNKNTMNKLIGSNTCEKILRRKLVLDIVHMASIKSGTLLVHIIRI